MKSLTKEMTPICQNKHHFEQKALNVNFLTLQILVMKCQFISFGNFSQKFLSLNATIRMNFIRNDQDH